MGLTASPEVREAGPEANAVGIFVGLVAAGACAALYLTGGEAGLQVYAHAGSLLAFGVLTLVLQFLAVNVYSRGSLSVSGVGMLATGFVYGPGCAMLVALPAALAHAAIRRPKLHRALFNISTFALSGAAGTYAFKLVIEHSRDSSGMKLLAATIAGFVFTATNVGLLSTAMSLSEEISVIAVWRERFRWLTPHYVAFGPLALGSAYAYQRVGITGLVVFGLPPALLSLSVRQYTSRTRDAVESLRESNIELARTNGELAEMALRLRRTLRETTTALSRSMEAKDLYTGGHTERVADVAIALGRRLGFTGEDLEGIEMGAILHDVGKIAIPDVILNKPAPLDDDEWQIMRTHPVISERIIGDIGLHPFVRQVARWSHERYDGRGYPDNLVGEAIPIAARIVLVADAWDAITSDRPYRRGRGAAAALAEIKAHAGGQFCPSVVAALEQIYREEPEVLGAVPHLELVAR